MIITSTVVHKPTGMYTVFHILASYIDSYHVHSILHYTFFTLA